MSIEHTVVFRLAHPAGSPAESDFLTAARSALTEIPGVDDFTVRRQVSPKSDLAWQFSMRFADQATYDAYNAHPLHVEFVATRWQTEVVAFQEYDFSTVDPATVR
ncbi:Dabb family protein [Actinophytocola sp.]|uniref:Dabb family protein n=1 Tax=Actinophytocola sp. TaxID=1872138 RepID=UPI002ED4B7B2